MKSWLDSLEFLLCFMNFIEVDTLEFDLPLAACHFWAAWAASFSRIGLRYLMAFVVALADESGELGFVLNIFYT